jgi:hypothetical protein
MDTFNKPKLIKLSKYSKEELIKLSKYSKEELIELINKNIELINKNIKLININKDINIDVDINKNIDVDSNKEDIVGINTVISKQTKGLFRNVIDKYYTNNNIVELCISYVKKYIQINKNDLIIEPSAGNGSFIKEIKLLSNNFKFYDLYPENNEIIKQDYLLYTPPSETIGQGPQGSTDTIHVIGNPPFGRQSSLAIKFIKKSCEFCNSISFILPKSFKKNSLKKSFPLNFHIIFEIDLPEKAFLVDGIEHNVPCIFQIWEKKIYNRDIVIKLNPVNFKFVKKTESPDISFRRVGVNAGVINIQIENKSIQSHYFIKFINLLSIDDNLAKLANVIYETNNTVGPKSISKQEIISKWDLCLEN